MMLAMHIAKKIKPFLLTLICAASIGLLMGMIPDAAMADNMPPGTCTTDPPFQTDPITEPGDPSEPAQGLISTIVYNIQSILDDIMGTLYQSIVTNYSFTSTVGAAVSLYILIYGILFTFGMVQITVYDFIMRMIKIGFIVLLLSPNSWEFFKDHVVYFFNEGTNDIISKVVSIAINGVPGTNPGSPFIALDSAITKAVSAKMAVTLQATAFTGPYGIIYVLLLLACLGAFVKALLTALWVYLMSLVLRTLLFGLAPIFLACLLFNRTRHLFDGWLNQVVNACLQPILLFIFFAFFAKLIEASIDQILYVPVCWTEAAESVRGTPFNMHYWRYGVHNEVGNFEPYGGGWSFTGPQDAAYEGRIFPLDLIAVLVFFMLAQLANRFNGVILMVARELAGATTDLSTMQGAFSEWFSGKRGGGLLSSIGQSRPGNIPGLASMRSAGGVAPSNLASAQQAASAGTGMRPTPK